MNPDYIATNAHSLWLLEPQNQRAADNLANKVGDEAQWMGRAVAVESRYIGPLVDQLTDEGWVVE